MILSFVLAASLQAATSPTVPPASPKASAAPPAASASVNLVPAFIGACINPGPNAAKIRATLEKAGGVAAPAKGGGPEASEAARLTGYLFKEGSQLYSVIFNGSGTTCTVVAREADLAKTKLALTQFVAGSTGVFDINMPKDPPAAAGESIVSAYVLTSRTGQAAMAITLSTVSRDGASATFLTRRLVAK